MKTTIDIPESLYIKAKIRAIERKQTLRQVVLASLERDLNEPQPQAQESGSYWTGRQLRPEFARLEESGAFIPRPTDRDITDLISEDRDGTESPLL